MTKGLKMKEKIRHWFNGHKKLSTHYILIVVAFLAGLVLPSPFFRNSLQTIIGDNFEELVDTANMALADGLYSGSVVKNSKIRSGYGRYETKSGSIYEGNWKDDRLVYGTRTTPSSVYTGHFDSDLNNDGFGIVNYSEEYIRGKQKQGLSDAEITTTYIGNWKKNLKQGLGRSVKKDGSMEFGNYSEGFLQKMSGANYRIGGSVYGIDLSHYQKDIDWNNLALYSDKNGNVYSNTPKDNVYMQPIFFVYLKATEGATIIDEMYSVRAIEAERHGIVKGAYHFLHLGSPIEDQLKIFFETVSWAQGDLPPALDVEVENEIQKYGIDVLQSMTLEWLQKVEKKLGVRPVIYTRESIRNKYFNDSRFKQYQFWIARYSESGPDNFDWQIWQKTEQGQIKGHKGNVDINLFRGNYESFKKYLEG